MIRVTTDLFFCKAKSQTKVFRNIIVSNMWKKKRSIMSSPFASSFMNFAKPTSSLSATSDLSIEYTAIYLDDRAKNQRASSPLRRSDYVRDVILQPPSCCERLSAMTYCGRESARRESVGKEKVTHHRHRPIHYSSSTPAGK